jgi:hypothetical protein
MNTEFNEYWNDNLSALMSNLEKIVGHILTDKNLVVARDAFGKIAKDIFYAGKKCNQDDVYNIQHCIMEQEKERKGLMDKLKSANKEIAELKEKNAFLELKIPHWIPVTERYPTEEDGKPEYEGDEKYTRVIVHVTEYYGKKWDRVMEIRFFEGTDFSEFCYKFDKWQPLPEA